MYIFFFLVILHQKNKTRNMLTQWKLTEKCVVPMRNNKNVEFVRGNQNEMKTWSKYQQCGFHLKLYSCAESGSSKVISNWFVLKTIFFCYISCYCWSCYYKWLKNNEGLSIVFARTHCNMTIMLLRREIRHEEILGQGQSTFSQVVILSTMRCLLTFSQYARKC